jgi:hypothetical protein
METIDVKDLPESIAQVIKTMVNTLRQQLQTKKQTRPLITLLVWEGRPLGRLTREEIYEDVG